MIAQWLLSQPFLDTIKLASLRVCARSKSFSYISLEDPYFFAIVPFFSYMASTTVVSSPGKVLVSGGYLVLDPKYSGTVVSTSSRFYTVIQTDASRGANNIRVRSPQFLSATWEYSVSTTQTTVKVEESPTKYVENSWRRRALLLRKWNCTLVRARTNLST